MLNQLNQLLLPQASKFVDEFSGVCVLAEPAPEIAPIENGVGTGLSCGVDSFYTIFRHFDNGWGQVTHLFFNNVGALTKDLSIANEIFLHKRNRFERVAHELNLPLVAINTNVLEVLDGCPDAVTQPGAIKNAACLFALKRGFRQYWAAGGDAMGQYFFGFEDNDSWLPMISQSVTLDEIALYPSGIEMPRIEKLKSIVDKDVVRKSLNVCAGENCGVCIKCTRTQFQLYALDRLDDFSQVFDIAWFKAHLSDRIAFNMADREERIYGFVREALDEANRNGVPIPFSAYVKSYVWYRPLLFFKRRLKENVRLRKLYDQFGLRERLRLGKAQN